MAKQTVFTDDKLRQLLDTTSSGTSVAARIQDLMDLIEILEATRKRSLFERIVDWFRQLPRSYGASESNQENRKADDDNDN